MVMRTISAGLETLEEISAMKDVSISIILIKHIPIVIMVNDPIIVLHLTLNQLNIVLQSKCTHAHTHTHLHSTICRSIVYRRPSS